MRKNSRKFFLLSFSLTFSLGLIFLFFGLPSVQATDVNVSANVPTLASCGDGSVDPGEVCDDNNNNDCDGCTADCTRVDAVCGDGITECGEACESDSDCSGDQTCTVTCGCGGGGCVPFSPPQCTDWGECDLNTGLQSQSCFNGCGSFTQFQSCGPACGDGNLDAGEECDDGNLTSNDCCSSSCTIQLWMPSPTVSAITNTSATINWTTSSWEGSSCQLVISSSILDWGLATPPGDGSVSLSGSTYSHALIGLDPGTTYHFLITATYSSLQTTGSGSFNTLGEAEICNDGVDNDNDSFIDYLDTDCYCEAEYECGDWEPEICSEEEGVQTRECILTSGDVCWNFEPAPDTSQSCIPECEVSCGACQQINLEQCICEDIVPCCGNNICESWAAPSENFNSCPQDCPVDCISDWQCDPWEPEPCPESGIQTRNCWDLESCLPPTDQPPTQRSCGLDCVGLTCAGACQQINLEQCICEEFVPCCGNLICEDGETNELCPQDCIEICIPNWVPTDWGECVNGIQTRDYDDINNCPYVLASPPDERCCLEGCNVACGLCERLDIGIQVCIPTSPCCGNRICESDQGENVLTCPVDCGIPPGLVLDLPQCLDGLDNDNDGFIDYPADPGCSKPSDNSELNLFEILESLVKLLDNPYVEQANKIATPILIATVAINTFATFSFFNFLSYLQFFFTQPFAALFRRKRRKWGIVYNALSKQAVDLAIVRLYKKENQQIVQSRVTDKLGRYHFLVDPGRYYITVTKPKFNFPTEYLKDEKEDIKYLDIYHGETIEIAESRADVVLNIPVDPTEEVKPVAKIIFQHYLRKVQYAAAFSAVPLATISMAINPGVLTFSMFGFHCLLFVLFRRLGYQKPPKNWGIVFDKKNRKPLGRAITRIYDKKYNKLLETRVTDARGRYSFLVNNNIYFVTAERMGYKPFKTEDIDLVSKDKEAIVDLDISLEKGKAEEITPSTPSSTPPTQAPITPLADKVGVPASAPEGASAGKPAIPAPPEKPAGDSLEKKVDDLEVSKKSLQDLLKVKEEVKDVKEDIDEKQAELEKLEEKVEDIEESIEEKIEKLDVENGQKSDRQDKQEEESKDTEEKPPEEKSIFG